MADILREVFGVFQKRYKDQGDGSHAEVVDAGVGPGDACVEVTPSDVADIAGGPVRALYVGTGGDVTIHDGDGNEIEFANVPAGTILPVKTRRVMNTGTDASDIVGIF